MGKFEDVVLGHDPSPRVDEQNQMVEGKIKRITAQGIYFTIKDWDNSKHEFGPAPYTWSRHTTVTDTGSYAPVLHTHVVPIPADGPAAGDRCLVVFVGGGVEDPWVIGWWPA